MVEKSVSHLISLTFWSIAIWSVTNAKLGFLQHGVQQAKDWIVPCTLYRLLERNKFWIRRIRRGQRSDTTKQNYDQTQRKELNIKFDISVNVDVFNRRLVTQFPKVALDYDFDLSRYCPTREFYSDLHCRETFFIVFKIHVCFMLDQNLQTVSFPCWDTSLSVITCFGVIQLGSVVINNVFIFRISFVVESFITIHSEYRVVLGDTIKNT
jgi:hypothetical protein